MSRLRVGINGFGRIGRVLFRVGFDRVEFVGINDMTSPDTLAHLLKYDSNYGTSPLEIGADSSNIIVNGKKIPVTASKDPSQIPWDKWEADIVFECTGAFKKKEDFQKHLKPPVKKVLVSAPADGVDGTFVFGVNHHLYDTKKHTVISNASCTTNCLAPVVKVLNDTFGIEYGFMTTVHSYTNDQKLLDAPHKDLRRARAAALSMIPTTTGAAKSVGLVIPEMAGRFDGVSIRVPTPTVSLVDFVATTKKKVSVEAVNEALVQAAKGPLKGILRCEDKELVSQDFKGDPASSIVDLPSTMTMGPNLVKVMSWYDNEYGFSNRMIDMALLMFKGNT